MRVRGSVEFLSQTNECISNLRTEPHETEVLNQRYTRQYECRDKEACRNLVSHSASDPGRILRLPGQIRVKQQVPSRVGLDRPLLRGLPSGR